MPEKVLLIVNPVSGRIALKQKLWQVIDKLCAADMVPTVCFTQKKGDAEKMAADACDVSGGTDDCFSEAESQNGK